MNCETYRTFTENCGGVPNIEINLTLFFIFVSSRETNNMSYISLSNPILDSHFAEPLVNDIAFIN